MTTKTTTIQRISTEELTTLLMGVNSGTFVNITMRTPVRMNKTGNPYHNRVEKISSRNYLMGNNYQERVKNNQEKEGQERNFVSEPPKGKRHVSKCVLVDTKTESVYYVMVEPFEEIKPQTEYVVDGTDPIEKELFEQWMVKSYQSKKQTQERKVMVLTPKIENIIGITIDGVRYEVS